MRYNVRLSNVGELFSLLMPSGDAPVPFVLLHSAILEVLGCLLVLRVWYRTVGAVARRTTASEATEFSSGPAPPPSSASSCVAFSVQGSVCLYVSARSNRMASAALSAQYDNTLCIARLAFRTGAVRQQ